MGISSASELVLAYDIGKNHAYEQFLFHKDCKTNITDIEITSTAILTTKNDTYSSLVLSHDFNNTAIGGSDIWNATSSKIEICQVVDLFLPSTGSSPKMVLYQVSRQVEVDVNLSVDYSLETNLTEGAISSETANVTVLLKLTSVPLISLLITKPLGRVQSYMFASSLKTLTFR